MEPLLILLVEDEALIITMIEEALTDAGFAVSTAARGGEAIRMIDAADASYSALITDIDLADDVSGWDVARHCRQIHPEFPVVYTSGGGAAEWSAQGVPNSVLVTKPFAVAQVVTAVSQLLNQGTTPGI